jgi:hypothetical protein
MGLFCVAPLQYPKTEVKGNTKKLFEFFILDTSGSISWCSRQGGISQYTFVTYIFALLNILVNLFCYSFFSIHNGNILDHTNYFIQTTQTVFKTQTCLPTGRLNSVSP